MPNILPCIVFAVFTVISPVFSQISWQALNGPTGVGQMLFLGADHDNRIFLRTDYQILTSTDNGDSWIESSAGLPAISIPSLRQALVLPSGKVTVLASGKHYAYDPGSNTWSPDSQLSGFGLLSVDNQQRLWQVKGDDIYYSTDGGQTFKLVLTGPQTEGWHQEMVNHNDEHNLVFVAFGTVGKIYHFKTDGTLQHVLPYNGGLLEYMGYSPFSGTAFLCDYDTNWRSGDGGLTWQTLQLKYTAGNSTYSAGIRQLYYESAEKIWALTDYGVFTSEDDGVNWTHFKIAQGYGPGYLFRTPAGSLFIQDLCTTYDFSRSTDEGQTWMDISGSFKNPSVIQTIAAKNDNLYAQNCNLFERSTDGGQTWSPATATDSITYPVNNLAVLPDGDLFWRSPKGRINRSSDGGNTWNPVFQPAPNPWFVNMWLKTDPFGNLYAMYEYPFSYKSNDHGQTWQPINLSSFLFYDNYRFLFHPNGDIFMFDRYGGPYLHHYIADRDTTITENLNDPAGGFLDIYDGTVSAQGELILFGTIFAQGWMARLYRYAGNGAVTPITSFPGENPVAITASPAGAVFVVSADSLFQSDNGGYQWEFAGKMPSGVPPYTLTNIQVGIDRHIYLSYDGQVVYRSTTAVATRNLISGVVWYDENGNCIREPNENGLVNRYVKATGATDFGGYSGLGGQYRVFTGDGSYQLSVQPPNALFQACPPISVTLNGTNDTAYADLALQPAEQCPYMRVNVSTPLLRRCFPNTYTVQYANEGTAVAADAYLEVTLDSLFDFVSASIPPSGQNGQMLTIPLGAIPPGESGFIHITMEVSCLAALGQNHCIKVKIFPGQPCLPALPDLSLAEECRANIGAFDPNDKRAFVGGNEEPGIVSPNREIEYLIRFQNTGTDTAFRVIVEDRIAGVLDIAAVTPLAASHPYSMELGADRKLRFIFDNILLPDSNINEAASHGFIKFSVRQLPDLPIGTVIRNTASIYFDFNDPVVTNTSELVVSLPTKVHEPATGYTVLVSPNPFRDVVRFRISGPPDNNEYALLLTDAPGRIVRREQFSGDTIQIARNGLPSGMYFFVIQNKQGHRISAGRILAE